MFLTQSQRPRPLRTLAQDRSLKPRTLPYARMDAALQTPCNGYSTAAWKPARSTARGLDGCCPVQPQHPHHTSAC